MIRESWIFIVAWVILAVPVWGAEREKFSKLYRVPADFFSSGSEESNERGLSGLHGRVHEPAETAGSRYTLSNEWTHSLPSLGPGAIYEVTEWIRGEGIVLEDGDFALYSPGSALLYLRSSQWNMELFDAAIGGCSFGERVRRYRVTVEAHTWRVGREQDRRPIAWIRFVMRDGFPADFAFEGKPGEDSVERLEILVKEGSFADLHVEASGKLCVQSEPFAFAVSSITEYGKTLTILEQGDEEEMISVSVHVDNVFPFDERKIAIDDALDKLGYGKKFPAADTARPAGEDGE